MTAIQIGNNTLTDRVNSLKTQIRYRGVLTHANLVRLYRMATEAAKANNEEVIYLISSCMSSDFVPYYRYKEGSKLEKDFNNAFTVITSLLNEIV